MELFCEDSDMIEHTARTGFAPGFAVNEAHGALQWWDLTFSSTKSVELWHSGPIVVC